jgi:hypothetical protein
MRYASPLRNGRSGTRDERFEKLSNGSRDRAVVLFQLTTAWITKRKQEALRTSMKSAPINGINAHPKLGYEVVRKHLGEVSHRLAKDKECWIEEGHVIPDHVHMLILMPPKLAVSSVAG